MPRNWPDKQWVYPIWIERDGFCLLRKNSDSEVCFSRLFWTENWTEINMEKTYSTTSKWKLKTLEIYDAISGSIISKGFTFWQHPRSFGINKSKWNWPEILELEKWCRRCLIDIQCCWDPRFRLQLSYLNLLRLWWRRHGWSSMTCQPYWCNWRAWYVQLLSPPFHPPLWKLCGAFVIHRL